MKPRKLMPIKVNLKPRKSKPTQFDLDIKRMKELNISLPFEAETWKGIRPPSPPLEIPGETRPLTALDIHQFRRDETLEKAKETFYEKLAAEEYKISKGKLDDFDLIAVTGKGAYSHVYLGRHKETKIMHAVKVIPKETAMKFKQNKNIIDEKKLLACIDCQFVVNLAYHFKDNANLYIVMEFGYCGDIWSLLRAYDQFRFDDYQVRFYSAQVILALEYLHKMDIIYRDVKPENLVLDKYANIKLCDFGFAKICPLRSWTLCGTPEYFAPEVLKLDGSTKATDWWGFGILLYEMRAGYAPFHSPRLRTLTGDILEGKFYIPDHFTRNFINLIQRLLQNNPEFRLGNLKGGIKQIKDHAYYATVNWDRIEDQTEWAPRVRDIGDESPPDWLINSFLPRFEDEPINIATSTENLFEKEFEEY